MVINKATRRLVKSNAGSVLVMTVIFSLMTILLGAAYLQYSYHHRLEVSYTIAKDMANNAAYAAMVLGMVENPSAVFDYTSPRSLFYRDGGRFRVDIQYRATTLEGGSDSVGFSTTTRYKVLGYGFVTGTEFDEEIISMAGHDMSSSSYADWLYITDRETQSYHRPPGEDTLRFWGPDTLDGKVHSNDKLHFQLGMGYWPVFKQFTTSCSTRFSPPYAANPGYVQFLDGYELGYHYFPFPLQADSVRAHNFFKNPNLGVSPAAQADSITEITLTPEGFIIRHRSQMGYNGRRDRLKFGVGDGGLFREGPINQCEVIPYPPPASKAIFIEGELWLAGAKYANHYNAGAPGEATAFNAGGFAGKLTIAASGDIVIAQDVVYADSDPWGQIPPNSPNILGLISEKHILMWRHCPDYLKVHAGLGAIGDSLQDRHIQAARCGADSIPPDGVFGTISADGINCGGVTNDKQELLVLGCLIMKERGLIHTTQSGGERGFDSKDYTYDWRFRYDPPPHFFVTQGHGKYYTEDEPKGLK